jgi:hypothetical protein
VLCWHSYKSTNYSTTSVGRTDTHSLILPFAHYCQEKPSEVTDNLNERLALRFEGRILNFIGSYYHECMFVVSTAYRLTGDAVLYTTWITRLFYFNEHPMLILHVYPFRVFNLFMRTFVNCEFKGYWNAACQTSSCSCLRHSSVPLFSFIPSCL